MPTFAYTAIDAAGKAAAGTVLADDPASARRQLQALGMTVRSLDPVAGAPPLLSYSDEPRGFRARAVRWIEGLRPKRTGVPTSAITGFYRDLATMLDAGIGIRRALQTLRGQAATVPAFFPIVTAIHDHVAGGGSLGEAMARYPDVFEELEVRAVESGELAGILDESLRRLATLRENRHRLRQRVITALTYPAMVVGIATVITVLLMTFVVPTILEPLIENQRALPLPTRIVKATSDLLLYFWWLLILGVVGAVVLFRWWVRTPAGRRTWHQSVLGLPVFGGLVLKSTVARAAMIIATMLRAGIGLVEAIQVAQRTCANVVLCEGLARWEHGVRDGLAPDVALSRARAFPPLMVEMVAVGEQSGKMEDTLDKLAETYEQQVQETADRLASLVEPAMVLLLGGMVLLIILAVFLPYLEILDILG